MNKTAAIVSILLISEVASATVPFDYKPVNPTQQFVVRALPLIRRGTLPLIQRGTLPHKWKSLNKSDYLADFFRTCDFLASMQSVAPDTNFGGLIEAEKGDPAFAKIIETDNTLEAIWVWSRYAQITKDTLKYYDNIKNAWRYCDSFPAWKEEGGNDDYYRVHNSAWGLLASRTYCETYKDTTRYKYGDTCANYIITHPLYFYPSNPALKSINPFVTGWAAGNLYYYGKIRNNTGWVDTAVTYGNRLIVWAKAGATIRLTDELWAMSSGTVVWGICNSVFQENAQAGQLWVSQYGSYVDTFQTWYNVDSYNWDNAWNVAYCNAQFSMYKISQDPKYLRYHKFIIDFLLFQDTDSDGGIPASTKDSSTEDMSWISSYLAFMGLNNILTVPDTDAALSYFVSPTDTQKFAFGQPIEISTQVSNLGLSTISPMVKIEGAYEDSLIKPLNFGESKKVIFLTNWTPQPDTYKLTAIVKCPGDENPKNDTVSITFFVTQGAVEEHNIKRNFLICSPNPFSQKTVISYSIDNPTYVRLKLYDLSGRAVRTLVDGVKPTGSYEVKLSSEGLTAGVYFIKFSAACGERGRTRNYKETKKLILMR